MGGYSASVVGSDQRERLRADRPPRDEEIKAFKVYVVQSENSRLPDPLATYEVLQSRQRDERGRLTQFLQEVAPAKPEEGRLYPVCKIIDKKMAREAEIAKRKSSKEKKIQIKQLEFSWTVTDNDMNYRLERLKEFLGRGWKVKVLFGAKRKGWQGRRAPTKEEVVNVLNRIKGAVREVEGAHEATAMEGKAGEEATLTFEKRAKR